MHTVHELSQDVLINRSFFLSLTNFRRLFEKILFTRLSGDGNISEVRNSPIFFNKIVLSSKLSGGGIQLFTLYDSHCTFARATEIQLVIPYPHVVRSSDGAGQYISLIQFLCLVESRQNYPSRPLCCTDNKPKKDAGYATSSRATQCNSGVQYFMGVVHSKTNQLMWPLLSSSIRTFKNLVYWMLQCTFVQDSLSRFKFEIMSLFTTFVAH